MRIKYTRLIILLSAALLLACGKPDRRPDGQERKDEFTSHKIVDVERDIAEQLALIEEAKVLKAKAESGDPVAARRWNYITSKGQEPIAGADYLLSTMEKSAAVDAKKAQLESIRKEMSQVGWLSIRPVWLSAKLGDADAQNELHDFFTQENLHSDRRVILKGSKKTPVARHSRHSPIIKDFLPQIEVKEIIPKVEVLADSYRQVSYCYLVDSFWTPPAGKWDPLYVEGRYRYDGIEFTPRDWLFKAAATDPRFKAKLAAMDFVSAKNEAERMVAAKALLSFADIRSGLEGKSLVESCLAAIYFRGIAGPADFSKSAEIMLSSADNALKARGVKLVCEKNLPVKQVADQVLHESEGLLYAIYSKYGYGHWKRDFERAYFEYWLFLWRVTGSPGGDANFARMELAELEKQLSAEEIISLQKKCMTWFKKFDGKSPYIDDWISR